MADQTTLRTPLQWTGGYYREPIWPREPDIAAVKSVAKQHLQAEFPEVIEDALLEVTFFAEGLYNKLYMVSYPGHQPSYLIRVTIPVVPFFKTESEVATIAYLRDNTSVPVPRIIAWQSNVDNELCYEWMLMEVIDGVPLWDVWRKIPWERKLEVVDELARYVKEIQDHKFDSIGALYFKTAIEHVSEEWTTVTEGAPCIDDQMTEAELEIWDTDHSETSVSADIQSLQLQTSVLESIEPVNLMSELTSNEPCGQPTLAVRSSKDDFAVGPLLDSLFFMENRLRLPGSRGPYPTQIEWLSGLIQVQLEWIKKGPIDGDEEYGRDFEEETPTMISLCHKYLETLPTIFAKGEEEDSCVLHHADLNLANILINPQTFDITGIVDWEVVNVVPNWKAKEHPDFMQSSEPFDEDEPPIPSYEDEEDPSVSTRDRWDNRLLRHHWDKTMDRLKGVAEADDDTLQAAQANVVKRELCENIPQLTDNIDWAQRWLENYKDNRDDRREVVSEVGEGSDGTISKF